MAVRQESFHASGHASGAGLMETVRTIKARVLVPVHTEKPQLFVERLSGAMRLILEVDPKKSDGWLGEDPAPRISAAEKEEQDMKQGRRNHSSSFKAILPLLQHPGPHQALGYRKDTW